MMAERKRIEDCNIAECLWCKVEDCSLREDHAQCHLHCCIVGEKEAYLPKTYFEAG